jgi:predicted metalloendopeptidase
MKTTQIPASKAQWGTYIQLRETAQEQVRTILDEVGGVEEWRGCG